ncbi:PLD nuclease N-terminal domain-containing protein [Arthrobacter sp. G119Y2]|uniref:PLD nuclease N-terminal domain-containing protein n=1 Tax=Arthrobacter sp. G119Y2 TaxID=3134965 RepID=UPI00311A7766
MPIEYLMWAPLVATSLVLYVTLAAAAFFSIANSDWVSPLSRRLWAATVILLPIAGAVLWLAASHRYNTTHHDDGEAERTPKADAGKAERTPKADAGKVAPDRSFLAKRKPVQRTTGKRTQAKRTKARRTLAKRTLSKGKPAKRTAASHGSGRWTLPVHHLRSRGGI